MADYDYEGERQVRTTQQIYDSLGIPPPPTSPHDLARIIKQDWKKPYFGAVPYLDALLELSSWDDNFYCDSATTIGVYFLANAQTWRGPTAKAVKAEIKRQLAARR